MTGRAIWIGIVLLLAMSPALSTTAFAQDDEEVEPSEFVETGGYIGIGATLGWANLGNQIGDEPISQEPDNIGPISNDAGPRFGIEARAGYRANRYLVWEFEYLYVDEIQLHSKRGQDQDFDAHSMSWTVKGYPLVDLLDPVLGGRLAPYAGIGIGLVTVQHADLNRGVDLDLRFAAGSDFHLNSNWSVYGEASYHMATMNLDGLDYLVYGVGIVYHFD